jgi:hypothetical protein
MKSDPRIQELQDLAAAEGISLPYPAEVIVGLEDKGHYVDLATGMVGDSGERIELTVIGEASVIVDNAQGKGERK